jgi:multisubunit Na+/H+ antiporter MnhB subunit
MLLATVVTHKSEFWPTTLGAWSAIVAGFAGTFAAVMSVRNRGKIQIVHDLVNSQHDELVNSLSNMTEKRDELVTEREAAHTNAP